MPARHDTVETAAGDGGPTRTPARRRGWPRASALLVACSGCGRCGADRAGVADLEVTWLLPDPDDRAAVRVGHYCRGCAPTGPVGELACAGCAEGLLLAGVLAEPADLATAAAVDTWLADTGWRWQLQHRSGPWCPACARALAPRSR